MSTFRRDADLTTLARAEHTVAPPKRGLLRVVIPAGILAAFAWALRDALTELVAPRVAVTLVRPTRLAGAASTDAAPTLALQAAGWVEPAPSPTLVPALTGGVVAELLVQESDAVAPGALVARLVAEDAHLARDAARAALQRAEALLASADLRARIAEERFDAALEVTEAATAAEARARGATAEVAWREAALRGGEADLATAESELVVQRELAAAGASGARQVELAEAAVVGAEARLAVLRAELAAREAAAAEAEAARTRAARDLDLRLADRLERDGAAAARDEARAAEAEARVALAQAELSVARLEVRAPVGGVVLERLTTPGAPLEAGASVCALYDPSALRVRVDVPQGDVRALFVGQAAEVLAESRPGAPYRGEVVRIVQRADIQKVTLEAQVRVLEPDDLLRPDMLAQVRFLSTRLDGSPRSSGAPSDAPSATLRGEAAPRDRLALPARLVDGAAIWVFDPVAQVARRRAVDLGGAAGTGDLVEVRAGLFPTDKVVDVGRARLDARGDDGDGVAVRVAATGTDQEAER